MFYRFGSRIFNLKLVEEIYIRKSLFHSKYFLGFSFTSNSGSFLYFINNCTEIEFRDEDRVTEEFNKIYQLIKKN